MALLERKKALGAKIESAYATDPTISTSTDGIQTIGLDIQHITGDFVTRGLDRSALGAEGDVLVSNRGQISFGVEAAGSGAAGTAPAWGKLMRACGFAETTNAGVSNVYTPVSSSFSSLWMEGNRDGNKHTIKGCRGNVSLNWQARQIPQFDYVFTGLYVAAVAAALPTYTLTAWKAPVAFNKANTPTATLHSESIKVESISIDVQNDIQHRDIPGSEEVLIVDRNVRGSITFEAPLQSTKDWWAISIARTQAALQIVHGGTAGNIIQLDAPKVELSNPRYSESQGVLMLTMDMILVPSAAAGNDEFTITAK